MDILVRILIEIVTCRKQLYSSITFARHDWRYIVDIFSHQFKVNTKPSTLECAMRKERHEYVIALFRERCKVAQEEQPEMGAEYRHWMEV